MNAIVPAVESPNSPVLGGLGHMIIGVFATLVLAMQSVQASEDLARRYNCVACHAVERRMVGPSFREVSARYSTKDVAQLAASIRKGGAGKWGAMPMPAYPQLSEADATALAKYVLNVK